MAMIEIIEDQDCIFNMEHCENPHSPFYNKGAFCWSCRKGYYITDEDNLRIRDWGYDEWKKWIMETYYGN